MPRNFATEKTWPSKFGVTVAAEQLAHYSDQITDNQKNFPPGQGTALVKSLKQWSLEIYMYCYRANYIRVEGRADYMERRRFQDMAIQRCEDMLPVLQLAKRRYHLSTKRMLYWGGMVIDVRDKIRAWKESDRKRYANLA
jgi:hypothetical protein